MNRSNLQQQIERLLSLTILVSIGLQTYLGTGIVHQILTNAYLNAELSRSIFVGLSFFGFTVLLLDQIFRFAFKLRLLRDM